MNAQEFLEQHSAVLIAALLSYGEQVNGEGLVEEARSANLALGNVQAWRDAMSRGWVTWDEVTEITE